jgi:phage terminase large subunit-like protein
MSSQLSISDAIKQELIKCKQDPAYFMKKYYTIQHPTKGRMTFNLFPFQEKSLKLFQRFDYCIINKSRQLGISTLTSAFALWMMLFEQDKNILVLATTQATAKNMVTKVRFAYDNLPSWMKLPVMEHNRLSLRLKNGSQIKAVSAATDSARSEAVSLLVIDEAAFIDNIDKIYTAAQQTLATGGRCIALSTPNGVGNWFHKEFTRAINSENNFTPINLPWTVHPERTQEWRDQQTQDLGVRAAAQECDCLWGSSRVVVRNVHTGEIRETNLEDL